VSTDAKGEGFSRLFFNINDRMGVKLTDKGRTILRTDPNSIAVQKVYPDFDPVWKTDADGYAGEQCWSIMQGLGSACGCGVQLPFGTQVRFNASDLYIDEGRTVTVKAALDALYAACKAAQTDHAVYGKLRPETVAQIAAALTLATEGAKAEGGGV